MRLATFCGTAAVAAILTLAAAAQPCQQPPELRPVAENLHFTEGVPGSTPPGWLLGPEWFMPPHAPVYEARIASDSSCNGSQKCAAVQSVREDPSVRMCFLYQVIDAAQYRGKRLTYRADVRADVNLGSVARLLVRVHRTDCGTSFRDDMGNHPITAAAWSSYEIQAPIAFDARDIEFGMQLVGQGAAWIDHISMTFTDGAR